MRELRSELETEREAKLQLRELFDKQATEPTLTLTTDPDSNPNPDPDPNPSPNPNQAIELRDESGSREEWRCRAEEFAADCDALQAQLLALTSGTVRDLRQSKLRLDSSLASLVDRSRFEAPEPRPSRAKASHLLKACNRGANVSHLIKSRQTPLRGATAPTNTVSPRGPGGTPGGTPSGGGDHLQRAADAAHMAPAGSTLDARLGMLAGPEPRRLDTQLSAGSTAQAALG